MRLRAYRPEDLPQVLALFYQTVHTVNAADYSSEQLDAWAPSSPDVVKWRDSFDGHYALIAEENGELWGFGDIASDGYLDRLYVHCQHQRQGIASGLVHALGQFSSQKGSRRLLTDASITAKPFFESLGFRELQRREVIRRGVTLVNYHMQKQLPVTPFEIIRLKPRDYPKCSSIWDMEKNKAQAEKWYQELLCGNRIIFVYVHDGVYLGEGALVLDMHDADYTLAGLRIYVSRLLVKPDCRRRGIGGRLLERLIQLAEQMGYSEMSVGVNLDNLPARRLYQKYGFSKVLFEGTDQGGEYQKRLKIL